MSENAITAGTAADEPIATAEDFDPDGALSRDYLLRRGRCCQEGCRNCPYGLPAVLSGTKMRR
ncbi:MAG: DUF5522 domain-containing protein [Chthoniobacterales bacterium]